MKFALQLGKAADRMTRDELAQAMTSIMGEALCTDQLVDMAFANLTGNANTKTLTREQFFRFFDVIDAVLQ